MAKFSDKTIEEWDNMVEQWHNDESIESSLAVYMWLDEVEFMRYIHNITEQYVTDEEVVEEAGRRTREAVVGLTLMEIFK